MRILDEEVIYMLAGKVVFHPVLNIDRLSYIYGVSGLLLKKQIHPRRFGEVIKSFPMGLPLGNLTSQLFANIYLNEMDHFIKQGLKVKHYIRYADDFVILSHSKEELETLLPIIQSFLRETLLLELHKDKVFFKTLNSGLDFLGWVHFFDHWVLRTVTKRCMFKKLRANPKSAVVNSYLGLLGHGNAHKVRKAAGIAIDSGIAIDY